jgi:RNase P subunit RPR2
MKDIFCIKCADITKHIAEKGLNDDVVFTCEKCKHFVKFPIVKTKEELSKMITEHEALNRPLAEEKAKAAEQDKILAELLK